MNKVLAFSAFIAMFTAAVHIVAGGTDIVNPLLVSTLDAETKYTLYAAWHMASAVLVFSAIALLVGSLPRYAQAACYLVVFISVLWCAFGVIFLAMVAIQNESDWLFKLPQWLLLFPVGVLGLWGSVKNCSQSKAHSASSSGKPLFF